MGNVSYGSFDLQLENPLSLHLVKNYRYLKWVRLTCMAVTLHDHKNQIFTTHLRDLFMSAVEFCEDEIFEVQIVNPYIRNLQHGVTDREIRMKYSPLETAIRHGISQQTLLDIEKNHKYVRDTKVLNALIDDYSECWDNSTAFQITKLWSNHHHQSSGLQWFIKKNQELIDHLLVKE